jgi:hypothetical protein
VAENEEIQNKTLCIGSMNLLDHLKARFEGMSESARADPSITPLDSVLDILQRHWEATQGRPKPETVSLSLEKLRFLMTRLTLQ